MTWNWSYGWGLAAQILVLWLVIAAISAPFIGRWIRVRRARTHLRSLVPLVVLNRNELEKAVRSDLKESAWQQNARRAESLGFIDPADGDAA